MQISNRYQSHQFTKMVQDGQGELLKLQQQISTGLKAQEASEDPGLYLSKIRIENQIKVLEDAKQNLVLLNNDYSVNEQQLKEVSNVLLRVKELAMQANSGISSITERSIIAEEIEQNLFMLVNIANYRNSYGDYIFSGYRTSSPTVQLDSNSRYFYGGDSGVNHNRISSNILLEKNLTGDELFFNVENSLLDINKSSAVNLHVGQRFGASGTLATIGSNDLSINNISLSGMLPDWISSSDNSASSLAIVNHINKFSSLTNVGAVMLSNKVNLGELSQTGFLNSGNLVINGISVTGDIHQPSGLAQAINNKLSSLNIVAVVNSSNEVELESLDGRNIQISSDGGSNLRFTDDLGYGFDMGVPFDITVSGDFIIFSDTDIDISGAILSDFGVAPGGYDVGSGNNLEILGIMDYKLMRESEFTVLFENSDEYSIFEYDISTGMQKKISNNILGDDSTIELAGVKFELKIVPSSGDSFKIDFVTNKDNDIFNMLASLVKDLKEPNAIDRHQKLSMHIENIDTSWDIILQKHTRLGSKMSAISSQEMSNDSEIIELKKALSGAIEIDLAETISKFTQKQYNLEAAQKSYVKMQNMSLLDYM